MAHTHTPVWLVSVLACVPHAAARHSFISFYFISTGRLITHKEKRRETSFFSFSSPLSPFLSLSLSFVIFVKWEENLINFIWSEVQEHNKKKNGKIFNGIFRVFGVRPTHMCAMCMWAAYQTKGEANRATLLTDAAGALPTRQSKNATETKWKIA